MSGPRVDLLNVRRAIQKLGAIYYKHASKDDLTDIWLSVLGQLSLEEFQDAVAAYMADNHEHFPKPGQLLGLALKRRARAAPSGKGFAQSEQQQLTSGYHAWEQTNEGPCPICGAELRVLTWEELGVEPPTRNTPSEGEARPFTLPGVDGPIQAPAGRFGVLHVGAFHDAVSVDIIGYRR